MPGRAWLWKWAVLDLRGLAAYRIALGVIVLADALLRSRDVALMFAPDGIFPPSEVRAALGGTSAWSLAWIDDSLPWGRFLLVLEGLAGLALACGWHTRGATVVAWIMVVSVVRRTAPATNAGDLLLGCLLLWGSFLPLGSVWSVDARWRGGPRPGSHDVVSAASAALLLQIAFVYFSAGLAKCNAVWFAGDAVAHALSVHDHGTHLGQWLAGFPRLTAPAGWAVVVAELTAAPLLLGWPSCRLRAVLAGLFILLHVTIWLLLSVGLFAPVGVAAWLAVVPGCVWDRAEGPRRAAAPTIPVERRADRVASPWTLLLVGLMVTATASAVAALRSGHTGAPGWLRLAIRLTALEQDWEMFGDVRPQAQWVRAVATLADGRTVDLLRGGVPCGDGLPAGGYLSLPHHRWHKLCWDLHRPVQRRFAPPLAAALAREWNHHHPATARALSVEIRNGRVRGDTSEEILLGSWPARSARDGGNLDRFLHARSPEPSGGQGAAAGDRHSDPEFGGPPDTGGHER